VVGAPPLAAVVNFGQATYTITEGDTDQTLTVGVNVSPTLTTASTVTVTAGDSNRSGIANATVNSDYTISGTPITLPANTPSAALRITIKGDSVVETEGAFTLTLSAIDGGPYEIGAFATITVTIRDDDDQELPRSVSSSPAPTATVDPEPSAPPALTATPSPTPPDIPVTPLPESEEGHRCLWWLAILIALFLIIMRIRRRSRKRLDRTRR